MIDAVTELGKTMSRAAACRALDIPRSSLYRAAQPPTESRSPATRPTPTRALSQAEKAQVRAVLNSERFEDQAPREVYATLLDEGRHYCHWRTMYRILAEHDEVHERRSQRRHAVGATPQLRATRPKQLWSWDITVLKGPDGFYYLYVILDVFSRYVPGWMLADREAAELAEQLIAETCAKEGIAAGQLVLHSDRGSAMRSKSVAQLLIDLGVARSHSRPYTPTDNPYSESQFKTLKYRPDYPGKFEGKEEAHGWARVFFDWYNREHHHTALGLLTPAMVHSGQAQAVSEQWQQVLAAAYAAHPERFVRGAPTPPREPKEVWINRPDDSQTSSGPTAAAAAAAVAIPHEQTGIESAARVGRSWDEPDVDDFLLLKFERELSQNH